MNSGLGNSVTKLIVIDHIIGEVLIDTISDRHSAAVIPENKHVIICRILFCRK